MSRNYQIEIDMKKSFYMLAMIGCALMYFFTGSCNKTPTFGEMKAAENKIIRKILAEKNIEILDAYPANGVFKDNQFYLLSSGIYLNVIDSGNGHRAVFDGYNSTDILVRTSGSYYCKSSIKPYNDTIYNFNTFMNSSPPFEFKYGFASSVVNEHSNSYDEYYYFFSMGLESILAYVGDSAVVKLLVPGTAEIGSSSPASSTFQSSGVNYTFVPMFYDRVRYTFYK